MAKKTREYINALFVTGYQITQADWVDIADTFFALLNENLRIDTHPVIATGILTLDCNSYNQIILEPRESTGTRTITTSPTIVFSNDTNTDLIHCFFELTGTVLFTMPSNVEVSNPSSIGTWDDSLKELSIAAGTADLIEFSFMKDKTSGNYIVIVSEVAL